MSRQKLSAGAARVLKSELLWLGIFTALSLWIHAKYRLSGFGEQDAARLSHDAIIWHLRGQILVNESTYRMHTSAGYIQLLKLCMDHGLKIAKLPAFMNSFSVAMGTACALALYALFRQFSAPRYAALGVFMYSMTPGFWLGNEYGMPTIPALFWFTLSMLCFVRACRVRKLLSAGLPLLVLAAFAWLFLAVSFKADLVLCTGAFVVAALCRRGRRWQMFGLASFVVLGAVFANNRYVHRVLIEPPDAKQSTADFLKSWSEQFPFKLGALLDPTNNQTVVHCAGGLLFSVLVLGMLSCLFVRGPVRWLAVGALAWGGPPVLFWALSYGNHSRHSVFGIAPMFLPAAHFVFRSVNERTARAALLGLLLVSLSYFSDTKGRGSVSPASNLLDCAERLENLTQGYHRGSRAVAHNPSLKRIIVGADIVAPYLDFEVFAAAKNPVMANSWEMHDGQQVTLFAHSTSKHQSSENAHKYSREGYAILSQ